MGVTAGSAAASALEAEGFRFVVPVEPAPTDFDGQGHLNNAAIVRIRDRTELFDEACRVE